MSYKLFYVYKIVNLINGKLYIGKTSNINKRMKTHIIVAKGGPEKYKDFSIIHKAIIKYGEHNFVIKQISEHELESDALLAESICIQNLKTRNNKIGYNCTNGGDGISGYKFTPQQIENLRKGRTGILHSEETKKRMSIIHTGQPYYGNGDPTTREKVSKMFRGKNGPNSKLNEQQVKEIKQLIKSGLSNVKIAKQFSVGRSCIQDIRSGRCWIDVIIN
jgi:group I intron endonuclease